jgi:hypothetical protein
MGFNVLSKSGLGIKIGHFCVEIWLIFTKTHFTKGMLDFALQKLRLSLIGLMEFSFLKTKTYLNEIFQLSMIQIQISGANFMGQVALKVKIVEKCISFPNEVKNFTNKAKLLTPTNI